MVMQTGEEIGMTGSQQQATSSSSTTAQYPGPRINKLRWHSRPWKQNICHYQMRPEKLSQDYNYSKTFEHLANAIVLPSSQITKAPLRSLRILPIINAQSISIYIIISFATAFRITVSLSITSPQRLKLQISSPKRFPQSYMNEISHLSDLPRPQHHHERNVGYKLYNIMCLAAKYK